MSGNKISREKLVESFSKHAGLINKYMFWLLILCFTYNLSLENTSIPFIIISDKQTVSPQSYHRIWTVLISCAITMFASTYLMALRIRIYYGNHYNEANDRDFFDLTVTPTIFRVAPIAWMSNKNKYVFFFNINATDSKAKKRGKRFYFFLKSLVFLIAYIYPFGVLCYAMYKSVILTDITFIGFFVYIFMLIVFTIAISSFMVVIMNESDFLRKRTP